MKAPAITLAIDSHHYTPVVSLRFGKSYGFRGIFNQKEITEILSSTEKILAA
jgi:hypothetical protein